MLYFNKRFFLPFLQGQKSNYFVGLSRIAATLRFLISPPACCSSLLAVSATLVCLQSTCKYWSGSHHNFTSIFISSITKPPQKSQSLSCLAWVALWHHCLCSSLAALIVCVKRSKVLISKCLLHVEYNE